jgi:hypothetical protein
VPLDVILLLLRVAVAGALYVFLGTLVYFLWKDLQHDQTVEKNVVPPAHLIVDSVEEDVPIAVGSVFWLSAETRIGRGPTNEVILPDTFASVEHALIYYRDGQWWLKDQHSRNGITVNEVLIQDAPIILTTGDLIGIGRVRMVFAPSAFFSKPTLKLKSEE